MFKTYYYKPDSTLANLEDIKGNYAYYFKQFPIDYPYKDAYYSYRYTNWDKIPVVMPALYWVLTKVKGKECTDQLCIRTYFLNLHKAQFWILLLIYIPIFFKTIQHLSWYVRARF